MYVDDVLFIDGLKSSIQKIAQLGSNSFEAKVEAEVTKFIGTEIQQDKARENVKIHSSLLFEGLLHRFGTEDSRCSSTPLPLGTELFSKDLSHADMDMSKIPQKKLIGSMLHLANTKRLDIAFYVGVLSRFLRDPWIQHWIAAKNPLRYFKKRKQWEERTGSGIKTLTEVRFPTPIWILSQIITRENRRAGMLF